MSLYSIHILSYCGNTELSKLAKSGSRHFHIGHQSLFSEVCSQKLVDKLYLGKWVLKPGGQSLHSPCKIKNN